MKRFLKYFRPTEKEFVKTSRLVLSIGLICGLSAPFYFYQGQLESMYEMEKGIYDDLDRQKLKKQKNKLNEK
jgi:hypothetical protein